MEQFLGEEPSAYPDKYLTPGVDLGQIPDDSTMNDTMDTTDNKKSSTLSRPDDGYNDTIEKALMKIEKQKDSNDYGRNFDESYRSDNVVISAPPVNAG